MSEGDEGGDAVGEGGNDNSEEEERYAEQEIAWAESGSSNGTGQGTSGRHERPEKPKRDWIDYLTVVALFATFLAALCAAFEADRLARDTERALSDASLAAQTAHNDNVDALNNTANAIGQAQAAADLAHTDNATALQAAKDANSDARKTSRMAHFDNIAALRRADVANQHAQDFFEAAQAPILWETTDKEFLAKDFLDWDPIPGQPNDIGIAIWTLTIHNSGLSMALNVTDIAIQMKVGRRICPNIANPNQSTGAYPPQADFVVSAQCVVSKADFLALKKIDGGIEAIVVIDYFDSFGAKYETAWCGASASIGLPHECAPHGRTFGVTKISPAH